MSKYLSKVSSFLREEDAPTMVEYGLLVALIALVALAAIEVVGGGISRLFEQVGAKLPAAPAGG